MTATYLPRVAFALLAALALGACSTGGGGGAGALSAGLTAPMDAPGARLNRVEALFLLNDYRRTRGAADVRGDTLLDATAQSLAAAYAKSGTQPVQPAGTVVMRVSAGYPSFAETFSGWRNSPADAAAISDPSASRVGLGVVADPNSTYGVYWVLLLGA